MREAYAKHYAAHSAVLISCFGDPGLLAPREICKLPLLDNALLAAQAMADAIAAGD